jgi:hypothetical protein
VKSEGASGLAGAGGAAPPRRGQTHQPIKQLADAEIVDRRTEEDRAEMTVPVSVDIERRDNPLAMGSSSRNRATASFGRRASSAGSEMPWHHYGRSFFQSYRAPVSGGFPGSGEEALAAPCLNTQVFLVTAAYMKTADLQEPRRVWKSISPNFYAP